MKKHYTSPLAQDITLMPEYKWRTCIAEILLLPRKQTNEWMQCTALSLLFQLECTAAQNSLRHMRQHHLKPQLYNADFGQILHHHLIAARQVLAPHKHISFLTHGKSDIALLYPRYIGLAVMQLLCTALQNQAHVTVSVNNSSHTLCIHAALPLHTLVLAREVAAMHGGRILQCDNLTVLQLCPQRKNVAYPCHTALEVNDILDNPLSAVNTAFASLGILGSEHV